MKSMIDSNFESLAQRSIYYFLATYPSFYSVNSADVSKDEQKAAYEFIKGIYEKLYENPTLLGFKLVPDDSFGEWELQKAKPQFFFQEVYLK